jgi:endoglucanase
MSQLVEEGYALDLWFSCDNPLADIDLRFEDSNLNYDDHPWRMNKRLTDAVVPFDGKWQHVQIPLSEFEDMGAWDPDDQTWYNPEGLFDWGATQDFQLVSETQVQQETEFYFDDIRVVKQTDLKDKSQSAVSFALSSNYPNPFNPVTRISYSLPRAETVTFSVYSLRGEEVLRPVDGARQSAGRHELTIDGSRMNSGVYVCKLQAGSGTLTRKMILVK